MAKTSGKTHHHNPPKKEFGTALLANGHSLPKLNDGIELLAGKDGMRRLYINGHMVECARIIFHPRTSGFSFN